MTLTNLIQLVNEIKNQLGTAVPVIDECGNEINIELTIVQDETGAPAVELRTPVTFTPFELAVDSALRSYFITDKSKDYKEFIQNTAKKLMQAAKKEIYPNPSSDKGEVR